MIASICFFSLLVSFLAIDDCIYLLVEFGLFHKAAVKVIRSVRSLFRSDKQDIRHVLCHLFKRLTIFSKGWPFFSYIASRKNGSIKNTMMSAAVLVPSGVLSIKKSGTPISAPLPKQTSCRFVKLNRNLVLTLVKSLGTGTYAILSPRFEFFLNFCQQLLTPYTTP